MTLSALRRMDYGRDLYEEQGEAPNLQGCINVRPSFGEPVIDFHHRSHRQEQASEYLAVFRGSITGARTYSD